MKNLITLIFSCLSISIFAQERVNKLVTESFDVKNLKYNTYQYNPEKFGDINPDHPGDYAERGVKKLDAGFVGEALQDFNESIKLYDEYGPSYYYKGICMLKLDSLDGAKINMEKAILYDPQLVEAYNELGNLFIYEGKLDSARWAFKTAIKQNENYPFSYYNIGRIEYAVRRDARAIRQFNKALKIDPKFAPAHFMKGVMMMYGKGRYKAAIKNFDKAIEFDDTYFDALQLRSWANISLKNYEKALLDINKCVELDSDDALIRISRAFLLILHEKKYEAAIDDLALFYQITENSNSSINRR